MSRERSLSQGEPAGGPWGPLSARMPGFASLAENAPAGSARAAIARAAQATGVDFSYLLAQAKLESSLDPNARAGTSSAAGLYQFTQGTWAQVLQQHGADAGIATDAPGGTLAALHDPAERARLMALRFDPDTSARMAAELAGDNQAVLGAALGRTPQPAELYLAHFLGSDGAVKFLSAMAADARQSAAALMPRAAAANRAVFFDASGAPRSLGGVMAMIETRMAGAMRDSGDPAQFGPAYASMAAMDDPASNWGGPLAQEFAATRQSLPSAGNDGNDWPRAAASMAETLNATFALGGDAANGAAPAFVRSAYGRLRAFGL